MDDDADHHGRVEQDPADAGKVNCLVVLLNPIDHRHAATRYETHETSETPPALRPTQIVSTCGTVMSMVKTERPLKTLSRPLTDGEPFDPVTQEPSAGNIVIASLLITRAHIAPGIG